LLYLTFPIFSQIDASTATGLPDLLGGLQGAFLGAGDLKKYWPQMNTDEHRWENSLADLLMGEVFAVLRGLPGRNGQDQEGRPGGPPH